MMTLKLLPFLMLAGTVMGQTNDRCPANYPKMSADGQCYAQINDGCNTCTYNADKDGWGGGVVCAAVACTKKDVWDVTVPAITVPGQSVDMGYATHPVLHPTPSVEQPANYDYQTWTYDLLFTPRTCMFHVNGGELTSEVPAPFVCWNTSPMPLIAPREQMIGEDDNSPHLWIDFEPTLRNIREYSVQQITARNKGKDPCAHKDSLCESFLTLHSFDFTEMRFSRFAVKYDGEVSMINMEPEDVIRILTDEAQEAREERKALLQTTAEQEKRIRELTLAAEGYKTAYLQLNAAVTKHIARVRSTLPESHSASTVTRRAK